MVVTLREFSLDILIVMDQEIAVMHSCRNFEKQSLEDCKQIIKLQSKSERLPEKMEGGGRVRQERQSGLMRVSGMKLIQDDSD